MPAAHVALSERRQKGREKRTRLGIIKNGTAQRRPWRNEGSRRILCGEITPFPSGPYGSADFAKRLIELNHLLAQLGVRANAVDTPAESLRFVVFIRILKRKLIRISDPLPPPESFTATACFLLGQFV